MRDEEIKKALSFDPLAASEAITGKLYKEDDETALTGMLLASLNNAKKKEMLGQMGDTVFGSSYSAYLEVITGAGFVKAYEHRHADGSLFCIYHKGGFVLAFDTYGKSINGGKLLYNWIPSKESIESKTRFGFTSSGGYEEKEDGTLVWVGDHDCREALLFNMRRLEENGEILDVWAKRPFLWFVHHSQTKGSYDYEEINEDVISRCTPALREIIGS